MKTIGVFGGSFNPPHVGHVMAVTYALSVGRFDKVLVVPTFRHAFDKDSLLIDFDHRLQMARIAFQLFSEVHVLDIERELPTPSYMVNTLRYLRMGYYLSVREKLAIFGVGANDTSVVRPVDLAQFRLIMGNDCAAEKDKWHKWDEIEEIAPPYILPRKKEQMFPAISSTMVRHSLKSRDVWHEQCVPSAVLDYIKEHDLYSARA